MTKYLNVTKVFLAMFILSFVACYLVISWHNRFSNDDFEFLKMASDLGVYGGIRHFYLNWEGAYFTEFLNFSFSSLANKFQLKPYVFNWFIFISVFGSFYLMVYRILSFFNIKTTFGSLAIVSLILGDLFYTDLALSEVWFWFNGNIAYLFTLSLVFLSIYFLAKKSLTIKELVIPLALLFLFAGTRFNYSIIALGVTSILILYSFFYKLEVDRKLLTLIFISLLIGTIVYLVAPGNYIRKNNFSISYKFDDILYNISHISWDYIKKFIIIKLPYHLIFIIPAAFIVSTFLKAEDVLKKIRLTLLFTITIASILLHSFVLYISKGAQTYRALPFTNMIVVTFLLIVFVFIILKIGNKFHDLKHLSALIFLLFSTTVFIRRLYIDYPIVKKYATAVDQRNSLIQDAKKNSGSLQTLYLCPLPPSGWLHSCEIGRRKIEKEAFNNIRLENYYNLEFQVDLKKNNDSDCN